MPSVGLAHSSSGVVRTSRRHISQYGALVVHTLAPCTTYSSPSRTARVRIDVVSVPASGSVTPNATCSSPEATRVSTSLASSGDPWRRTGSIPKIDRWIAEQPFIAAPDAAISSSITDASVMPCPPPPNSSGMAMPTQPPSASAS